MTTQWTRFFENCKRVRSLSGIALQENFYLSRTTQQQLSSHLLGDKRILFPNLQTLVVTEGSLSWLFMSSSVRNLVWVFDSDPPTYGFSMRDTIDSVHTRMPHISHLSLIIGNMRGIYDLHFSELLSGLHHLEIISFTRHSLSPQLLSSMSFLPELRIIDVDQGRLGSDPFFASERADSQLWHMSPFTFHNRTFKSLRQLSMSFPDFGDARSFFELPRSPSPTLEVLDIIITFPRKMGRQETRVFLERLGVLCHNLRVLRIEMVAPATTVAQVIGIESLDFSSLEPILAFPYLTGFTIVHTWPLDISDSDVENLSRRWPALESLSLNRHPAVVLPPKLSLSAIVHFARWCPHMTHLSLYINATVVSLPRVLYRLPSSFRCFNVGASPFPFTANQGTLDVIVSLLVSVLPSGCSIGTGFNDDLPDTALFSSGTTPSSLVLVKATSFAGYDEGWRSIASVCRIMWNCQE